MLCVNKIEINGITTKVNIEANDEYCFINAIRIQHNIKIIPSRESTPNRNPI